MENIWRVIVDMQLSLILSAPEIVLMVAVAHRHETRSRS